MDNVDVDDWLSTAIIQLWDENHFYGAVLARLQRRSDPEAEAGMTVSWHIPYWVLTYNPVMLLSNYQTTAELVARLTHEILHLVWEHPQRYTNSNRLIEIATDIAVNQYIEAPYFGKVTLAKVNHELKLNLPSKADSAEYLTALINYEQQSKQTVGDNLQPPDGHGGWQSSGGTVGSESRLALAQLIREAHNEAVQAGRGQVPGEVGRQIDWVTAPQTNWRQLLRQSISNMPMGQKDSRARFNRRQPYRLELPVKVQDQSQRVAIYVDNSASMNDRRVAQFMAEIEQIRQQLAVPIDVFQFDTEVTPAPKKKLTRRFGGGTIFAAIFADLQARKQSPRTVTVVILTDGEGERELKVTEPWRVLWVLLPDSELSVQEPIGQIVNLQL